MSTVHSIDKHPDILALRAGSGAVYIHVTRT